MWKVRRLAIGNYTSLIVRVPRLAIRSRQAMIGVPSMLCRRATFLFAASEGSAGRTIDGRSRFTGSWSATGAALERGACGAVCQHAQEHVRPHARRESMTDGVHLHIHALQRPKRPFNEGEAFVGRDRLLWGYLVRWKAGPHKVDAVKARLTDAFRDVVRRSRKFGFA